MLKGDKLRELSLCVKKPWRELNYAGSWELFEFSWWKVVWDILPRKKPEGGGPSVLFLDIFVPRSTVFHEGCRDHVGWGPVSYLSLDLSWSQDLNGSKGCPPDEDLVSKIFFVYILYSVKSFRRYPNQTRTRNICHSNPVSQLFVYIYVYIYTCTSWCILFIEFAYNDSSQPPLPGGFQATNSAMFQSLGSNR